MSGFGQFQFGVSGFGGGVAPPQKGTVLDVVARLQKWLPSRWFPSQAVNDDGTVPRIYAMLTGFAAALSAVYSIIAYAADQTRIATATDGFLDLIGSDYFGRSLLRKVNETDAVYSARIQNNLFAPRVTRQAMSDEIEAVIGAAPIIFEPWNTLDTGGYGKGAGLAYGRAGGYGSLALPCQAFITVSPKQATTIGMGFIGGYYPGSGWAGGGYGTGSLEYISNDDIASQVQDTDIYNVINQTKPAGTTMWVRIL